MVGTIWEASFETCLIEGFGSTSPRFRLAAVADYRAVGAVKVVGIGCVGFQLAEVRQRLLKAPLVVAPFCPRIVILRNAAQEYLAVDGAGTARDLAAWDKHGLCFVGGPSRELPVVVAGHNVGGRGVAVLHFLRQAVQVWIVWPCLQQQHRGIRVLSKPRSQYGPGRPCANDYVVVLQSIPPYYSSPS